MKIVFLNPSGQLGGAERSLLDILASLRAAVPEWGLQLIGADNGPLVSAATSLGVPTAVLPFPPALARMGDAGVAEVGRLTLLRRMVSAGPVVLTYIKQLRRALRALAPDMIHSNGFKMHILGSWARPNGIPIVWHLHDYISSRPVMSRLLRWHASACAAIIANSKSVAEDAQSTIQRKPGRVYPVHNAIDLDRFSPTGLLADLDALSGLPPAGPSTARVGLVATLAHWKGHEVFLRALSLLPRDLAVRGYIVGDALYQTDGSQYTLRELRGLAARLGLEQQVGFTGFVEEPAAAMRALDIVVHASTQPEPFGLVIAEAMACGRAVIASQGGGAAEIIKVGENALGHLPGDGAVLAERIVQLATDAELRARLGKAGRATAERRFDRTRLAAELMPIYLGVMRCAADAAGATISR